MSDAGETALHSGQKPKTRARRSRTGCAECRSKKIKCDETRPTCRQCLKAGRSCSIADSIFKPHALSSETNVEREEVVINARDVLPSTGVLQGLAQDTGVYRSEDVVSQPAELTTNAHVTPLSEDRISQAQQVRRATSPPRSHTNQSIVSVNLASPHSSGFTLPHDPAQHYSGNEPHSRQQFSSTSSVHNGAGSAYLRSPNTYASNTGRAPQLLTPSVTHDETSLDHYEEAFFLRYFSEHIAPWLDLVNFQRYFGHECITLLRENSLLRFATCALAAKQLSQSPEPTTTAFCNPSKAQTAIARMLLQRNPNFLWYGAKYYDKAITTLARQLAPHTSQVHSSPRDLNSEGSLPYMLTRADGEDPIVRLLATCLLIQFENLSGNSRGWTGHLDGFSRLLALLDGGHLSDTSPLPQRMFDARSQRALRAAFWWFVINDMEESFVNRRRMRINLENAPLWRRMGLHMDDDGRPLDLDTCETPDAPPHLQEDLLSFVLMRIVCRLVNVLALVDNPAGENIVNSPHGSMDTETLQSIQSDLDHWMLSTTASFQPVSTWRSLELTNEFNSDILGTEMWYSHSLRAVTVLYYHMACMLLLIHQPTLLFQPIGGRKPFDLLRAMEELRHKLRSHAGQVVAIVTGMSADGAVRVRAVQPLYIAGRSLTEQKDRKSIVQILRSIQDDLGLTCEYRITDLMQEWSVSYESLGISPRPVETSHPDVS